MAVTETLGDWAWSEATIGARNVVSNSGTSVGDLLIMVIAFQDLSATSIATPSGWSPLTTTTTTGSLKSIAFYRYAATGGAVTYSYTGSGGSGTWGSAAQIITVKGSDVGTPPVSGTVGTRAGSGGTTNTTAPTYTTGSANMRLYVIGTERTNAVETGTPAVGNSFTVISGSGLQSGWNWNAGTAQSIFIAAKTQASAGASGTTTIGPYTNSNGTNAAAWHIAVKEGASGPGAGYSNAARFKFANGVTPTFYVKDGTGTLVTPSDVFVVRPGFDSVQTMMTTPYKGTMCMWRFGGVNYPEFAMWSATQCVFKGYGWLELSLGCSSDGVWFGLHDAYLDRVVLGTNTTTLLASSMTWAAINAYTINYKDVGVPVTTPKPFAKFDDIMAAYGGTHVFMVDPKHQIVARQTEFLDMLDANGGPSRFIVKCSGSSIGGGVGQAFATAAGLRGYQSWGYFYQSDYDDSRGPSGVQLALDQVPFTILGMEIGANTAAWGVTGNGIRSYSKPIIAHIAKSQTEYNTAISKLTATADGTFTQWYGVQSGAPETMTVKSWWT